MGDWATESTHEADVGASAVWTRAYADVSRWKDWNSQIAHAALESRFALGGSAKIRFTTGLRMRFRIVELEPGRVFTDEARLPLARMGHRHLIEDTGAGVRLVNRIYIQGPLAWLWSRILGPRAKRELPEAQRRVVALARDHATRLDHAT